MLGIPVLLAACVIGGVQAQCGKMTVPENRSAPAGRQIELSVAVLPATVPSARRADPLFYITGGPGGVDLEQLPGIAGAFSVINRHRDIVFVDQRGVGGSNPLRCKLATLDGKIADLVAACLGQVAADVTMYRTPEAMDDLDAVRQALGYGQIDLYGGSYGATAAQVYLRRHPETVRAVVLDGVTLLDIPVFERWASSAQRALGLLNKRCKADEQCRQTFPHWFARFPALLARLAKNPVRVGKVTVDAAETAGTVDEMLAWSGSSAPSAVHARAGGEGELFGDRPRDRQLLVLSQEIAVMPIAIMCTEAWAARDPAIVTADSKGTFMAYTSRRARSRTLQSAPPGRRSTRPVRTGHAFSRTCRRSCSTVAPIRRICLSTPPASSRQCRTRRSLLAPNQGHGISTLGCVPVLIDRFLERGTATGLDASCVKFAPLTDFSIR